ncbi:unnamed protein product, partial [Meganyctiphanes norvegica]
GITTEVMQLLILLFALMNRAQATSEALIGCGPEHSYPCKGPGSFINDFEDNPEIINGEQAFEKDIVLGTDEQKKAVQDQVEQWLDDDYSKYYFPEDRSINRKAEPNLRARWPEGNDSYPLVPYTLFQDVDNDTITAALDHWMEKTCIVFELMSDSFNVTQPHLKFIKDSGCWSYIGMMPWKGQPISIGNG